MSTPHEEQLTPAYGSKRMDRERENGYFWGGGFALKYWSLAFMTMGAALIAAIVIKFDWFGAIAGVISLFMGYALSIGADLKDKE